MGKKLLIFDFDGTLVDSREEWYKAGVKVLGKESLYCPECEMKLIIHFGRRIEELLEEIEISRTKSVQIAKEIHAEFMKRAGAVKLSRGFGRGFGLCSDGAKCYSQPFCLTGG